MSTSVLPIIQNQLTVYGYLISMVLGNVGNIFVIIIFTGQRQNACSIYLISSAVINNIYLTFNSLVQVFPFYYADHNIRAFILCKLRSYLPNILGLMTKTLIVLACIDRFLITNNHANFRAFSTPKRAKYIILFLVIFWPLFCSHVPIMTTIVNGQCNQFGIYSTIYTVYIVLFVGLIPPITAAIFGYLTHCTLRQRHIRVQPIMHEANISVRRRDRELLILVMSEVFIYLITAIPYPLILLEMMISRYTIPNKSVQYLQIENFILGVAFLLIFINFAAPFYIYLISSKAFRRDFRQLMIKAYRKLRRQPVIRIVPRITIHHAFTQNDTHV